MAELGGTQLLAWGFLLSHRFSLPCTGTNCHILVGNTHPVSTSVSLSPLLIETDGWGEPLPKTCVEG